MENQSKETYLEKVSLEKEEIPSDTLINLQNKENLMNVNENDINKENGDSITNQEKEKNMEEENKEELNDQELNEMVDNPQEEELNKQIRKQEENEQEIQDEKEQHDQENEGEDIREDNENVEENEQEQYEELEENKDEENQDNYEAEYSQKNQIEEQEELEEQEYKERQGIHIHRQTEEELEQNMNQEENNEEDTGKIHPVEQNEEDINQNEEKIEYNVLQQAAEEEEENKEQGENIEQEERSQEEMENYEKNIQEGKYMQPLDNKQKIYKQKEKIIIEKKKKNDNIEELPRIMVFKMPREKETHRIVEKELTEKSFKLKIKDYEDLVEIPKDKIQLYEKKEIIVLKGGIETGEYKFLGSEDELILEEPMAKATISKEEILSEINRRNNTEKKISYEVIDKYYSLTVFDEKKTGVNISQKESEENNEEINLKIPKENFCKYLLEQINKIRADPQSFIGVIEDAKDNIKKRKNGKYYYNGNKIKVALIEGESAFNETIYFLKSCKPMEPLTFSQSLIPPIPQDEEEINDKNYLKKNVEKMLINGLRINSYWRDVINDAEICFLLMIVDDNGDKKGMRRNDILNPKMKEIGISSFEVNRQLVNYFVLSS